LIETTIRALLATNSGVSALVGANIFPVVLPRSFDFTQGDALTYAVVSGEEDVTLDSKQWSEKRIQIDAWSSTWLNTKNIQIAVKAALDGASVTGLLLAYQTITLDTKDEAGDAFRSMVEYQVCFTQ